MRSACLGCAFVVSQRNLLSTITGSSRGGSGRSFPFPSLRTRNVRCPSSRVGPKSSVVNLRALVQLERRWTCKEHLRRLESDSRRTVHVPGISEMVVGCTATRELSKMWLSGPPAWRDMASVAQESKAEQHTQYGDNNTAWREALDTADILKKWHTITIEPVRLLSTMGIREPAATVTTGL
jgi:hypothetical protein